MIGHEHGNPDPLYRHLYDFEMRECIGKTDSIYEPLCMHTSIVAREMALKGVIVCRVCNAPLPEGKGRYNDHKILRHPECVQPICTKCAHEQPDKFYLAFKRGNELMHAVTPLYIRSAHLAFEVEMLNKQPHPHPL